MFQERSWPLTVAVEEVAVPPLATPKTPLTSLLPRAIAPLNREPAAVDLTGKAEERLAMVVEPEMLAVPETPRVATGEVEEMPTLPKAVTLK